ncbi:TetR family transcriptional regulator [Streptomyces sp. NPDC057702]|uniref:TetR family transcriptional regulator n=1 Tax=unclassified Streptomyces TaxID=2593676 RepID=UPI0036BBCFCA
MGRWEPNARERLATAAMELYEQRGFEQTTVAEIARRAGLTERTFFRHYADKREVLCGRSDSLEELMVSAVAAAPAAAPPWEALGAALEASAAMFEGQRDFARWRQSVIAANAQLQERELIKFASLAAALDTALRERGIPELTAQVSAETGVAALKVAFARWLAAPEERPLVEVVRETLAALRAVTTPPSTD